MRNGKIISGIVVLLLSIGCVVYSIVTLINGLQKEGPVAWKINSFQPAYQNEALVILILFVVGIVLFFVGFAVLVMGIRERRQTGVGFR